MDIYASDEEKGEEIKQWWRDNGTSVVIACLVAVASVFGTRYWFAYQQSVTESASMLYQTVISSVSTDNLDSADESAKILLNDYSNTPYAVFSALEMAELFSTTDAKSSEAYYSWVIDNAALEGHVEIARLRLARLLMNESQYDDALMVIAESTSTAFTSLFSELRGDIFIAKKEKSQAHAAYKTAIANLAQGEPRQQLLELKLDATALSNDG